MNNTHSPMQFTPEPEFDTSVYRRAVLAEWVADRNHQLVFRPDPEKATLNVDGHRERESLTVDRADDRVEIEQGFVVDPKRPDLDLDENCFEKGAVRSLAFMPILETERKCPGGDEALIRPFTETIPRPYSPAMRWLVGLPLRIEPYQKRPHRQWRAQKDINLAQEFLSGKHRPAMAMLLHVAAVKHGLTMDDLRAAFGVNGRPSTARRELRARVRSALAPIWAKDCLQVEVEHQVIADILGVHRQRLYELIGHVDSMVEPTAGRRSISLCSCDPPPPLCQDEPAPEEPPESDSQPDTRGRCYKCGRARYVVSAPEQLETRTWPLRDRRRRNTHETRTRPLRVRRDRNADETRTFASRRRGQLVSS